MECRVQCKSRSRATPSKHFSGLLRSTGDLRSPTRTREFGPRCEDVTMSEVTRSRGGALRQRRKTNRGSTMVEMGLIGTMLFVLLLGIVDMGQVLFLQQAMVERARSAARWGSVTDPTNSVAIQNMVLYLQPTEPHNGGASFGLTPAMVSVSTADAG